MPLKGNTEKKTEKGEGKRKWRRGNPKENASQWTTRSRTGTEAMGKGEDKSDGGKEMETPPEDGEVTAGDVPGYQPTLEDLRLR